MRVGKEGREEEKKTNIRNEWEIHERTVDCGLLLPRVQTTKSVDGQKREKPLFLYV
jgi:hypothetical protein